RSLLGYHQTSSISIIKLIAPSSCRIMLTLVSTMHCSLIGSWYAIYTSSQSNPSTFTVNALRLTLVSVKTISTEPDLSMCALAIYRPASLEGLRLKDLANASRCLILILDSLIASLQCILHA